MEGYRFKSLGWLTALAILVGLIWLSGNRGPVDEIAVATNRTGVDFESRMVDVGGVRLHVALAGPADGPKVVLLHGFPEFWYTWHSQMAVLARAGYRVAAPDTRGTNRSDKPSDPDLYTDLQLVEDVVGVMDVLGWDRAFLGGHDVGGGTAWQLVFAYPERIRAAILFNVPHPLAGSKARPEDDSNSVSWFRGFFRLPFLPELVSRAGDWWLVSYYLTETSGEGAFDSEELALYKSSWARDGAMGKMINTYRAPLTELRGMTKDGRPTIPVRLIWGDQDAFVPYEGSVLSEAYLPKGAIEHWPEQSHWILHEEPERTAATMLQFFANESVRGSSLESSD